MPAYTCQLSSSTAWPTYRRSVPFRSLSTAPLWESARAYADVSSGRPMERSGSMERETTLSRLAVVTRYSSEFAGYRSAAKRSCSVVASGVRSMATASTPGGLASGGALGAGMGAATNRDDFLVRGSGNGPTTVAALRSMTGVGQLAPA